MSAGAPGRVAVVGGGISGLVTAYRLAGAGVPVTLFESDFMALTRSSTDWNFESGLTERIM